MGNPSLHEDYKFLQPTRTEKKNKKRRGKLGGKSRTRKTNSTKEHTVPKKEQEDTIKMLNLSFYVLKDS